MLTAYRCSPRDWDPRAVEIAVVAAGAAVAVVVVVVVVAALVEEVDDDAGQNAHVQLTNLSD